MDRVCGKNDYWWESNRMGLVLVQVYTPNPAWRIIRRIQGMIIDVDTISDYFAEPFTVNSLCRI